MSPSLNTENLNTVEQLAINAGAQFLKDHPEVINTVVNLAVQWAVAALTTWLTSQIAQHQATQRASVVSAAPQA